MARKLVPRPTITPKQYREANQAYVWFAEKVCAQLRIDHPHLDFYVNPEIALDVSIATYDDIDRYKSYHLRNAKPGSTDRSDATKRAAYFAKWTTKLRPIQFRHKGAPKSDPDDMALMANETLAIAYAIALLGEELKIRFKLSEKTLAEILYDLHFRDINDDALLSLFHLIRDIAEDGRNNPILEQSVNS